MRPKPYARGGCHSRNNVRATKFLTILVSDVHRSHSIAVCFEATLPTAEVTPLHFTLTAVSTLWACSTGVAFLLQDDLYPNELGFVAEHVNKACMWQLDEVLFVCFAHLWILLPQRIFTNNESSYSLLYQQIDYAP